MISLIVIPIHVSVHKIIVYVYKMTRFDLYMTDVGNIEHCQAQVMILKSKKF
jgi:hypothetical protein